MPWWGWMMLWNNSNNHNTTVVTGAPSGGAYSAESGQPVVVQETNYNWIGFLLWGAILGIGGYFLYRYLNRSSHTYRPLY